MALHSNVPYNFISSGRPAQFNDDDHGLVKLASGKTAYNSAIASTNVLLLQVYEMLGYNVDKLPVTTKSGTHLTKIAHPVADYEMLLTESQLIAIGWFVDGFLTPKYVMPTGVLLKNSPWNRVIKNLFTDMYSRITAIINRDRAYPYTDTKALSRSVEALRQLKTIGDSIGLCFATTKERDVVLQEGEVINSDELDALYIENEELSYKED